MKTHKTPTSARTEYTYEFADGTKVTLSPGKDGVTELDIKELHRLDDREVECNIRNSRPERTSEQKEVVNAWKEKYSRSFEERYGYTPNATDIQAAADIAFPANWNISLDEVGEKLKDKTNIICDKSWNATDDYQEKIEERIAFLLEGLTGREKEIYRLVVKEGLKKYEAGKILGISDSYVSRVMKKIRAIIEADEIIKKLHLSGSDFSSNRRL